MAASTRVQQLWFTDVHQVACREGELAPPTAGEVLVKTRCSAISAGTELLVYRGKIPPQMALDATLDHLNAGTANPRSLYPLQYGYACVGHVLAVGSASDSAWIGQRVFSFQPHVSHFVAPVSALIPVPADVPDEAAVFLANMETAVNLVQDGAPMIGEQVVVLGQGIVGLLLTAVLAQHPLAQLLTLDTLPARRSLSLQLGASASADACENPAQLRARYLSQGLSQRPAVPSPTSYSTEPAADLIYEVSGVPAALNTAIALSGFDSRIVIGSWYGTATAPIVLGAEAHRNRLRISTSQVSTLASGLSGRWDKQRRFQTVWQMIRRIQPQQLISHRVSLADAASMYQRLHEPQQSGDDITQAIFIYHEDN